MDLQLCLEKWTCSFVCTVYYLNHLYKCQSLRANSVSIWVPNLLSAPHLPRSPTLPFPAHRFNFKMEDDMDQVNQIKVGTNIVQAPPAPNH